MPANELVLPAGGDLAARREACRARLEDALEDLEGAVRGKVPLADLPERVEARPCDAVAVAFTVGLALAVISRL